MKKWLRRFKENERGLTLVELLAVVVILAIVGAIAFVAIGNVIENSKKDAHVANAQQLISAAKLYDASGNEFDNTASTVSTVSLDTLKNAGYIGEFTDPWGGSDYTGVVKKDTSGSTVTYSVQVTGTDTDPSLDIGGVDNYISESDIIERNDSAIW